MQKAIALGIAIGLTTLVGYSAFVRFVIPVLLPVDTSTLEVTGGSLGDLKLKESQVFELTLSNSSARAIVLQPPTTTCGCIRVDSGEIVVPARGVIGARFRLNAPGTPGTISKAIILVARDFPALRWEVPITGTVVAPIWAEPSELNLESEAGKEISDRIIVHHVPDLAIAKVSVSSGDVKATTRMADDEMVEIHLSIDCGQEGRIPTGTAVVQVVGTNGAELLRIPVSWKPRGWLRCFPAIVDLDQGQAGEGSEERTLLLFSRLKKGGTLRIESLVPWIHVEQTQPSSFGFVLHLKIDAAGRPPAFDAPILKISDENETTPVVVSCRS
jgi:hypothetical protein